MLNYIGVFLTFRCGLACDYCINRAGEFKPRAEIDSDEWMKILEPIQTREDLPITLQGGEPTEYREFYELVQKLYERGHKIDLLTNGYFSVREFLCRTKPEMFRRKAPYASIRFSFHKKTSETILLPAVVALLDRGYSVGIWGLDHPEMSDRNEWMQKYCKNAGIDFRMKEFLDGDHGTYKYPDAITGLKNIPVICHPSEMLFAPDGQLYPCHHFLYSGKYPVTPYAWDKHAMCHEYGLCNPCDIKLKTNRLQEGGHCSVKIELPSTKNCKGY